MSEQGNEKTEFETACGERKHGTMKTGDDTGPVWCDGAELMSKLVLY